MDNIKNSTKPISKVFPNSEFTQSSVETFLDSVTAAYSGCVVCNECLLNFNYYYSRHLVTNNKPIGIFNTNSSQIGALKSFVVSNPINNMPSIFPDGAVPGGSFIVTANSSYIPNGATLYLPRNFTILVDTSVSQINWTFSKVLFDDGATIDLSQRNLTLSKLPTPPPNNDTFYSRECPGPCVSEILTRRSDGVKNVGSNGAPGRTGAAGQAGFDGKYFSLVTYFLSSVGNLWIRTDGQDGQDGQDGGDGGYGARGDCNGTFSHGIDGGKGGSGGLGGPGGPGGSTSLAMLQFLDVNGTPIKVYNSTTGFSYSPSIRPPELTDNHTGLIVINGNPGKGGAGGRGGKAGDYGHGCMCGCSSTNTSNDGSHEAAVSHFNDKAQHGLPGMIKKIIVQVN